MVPWHDWWRRYCLTGFIASNLYWLHILSCNRLVDVHKENDALMMFTEMENVAYFADVVSAIFVFTAVLTFKFYIHLKKKICYIFFLHFPLFLYVFANTFVLIFQAQSFVSAILLAFSIFGYSFNKSWDNEQFFNVATNSYVCYNLQSINIQYHEITFFNSPYRDILTIY